MKMTEPRMAGAPELEVERVGPGGDGGAVAAADGLLLLDEADVGR